MKSSKFLIRCCVVLTLVLVSHAVLLFCVLAQTSTTQLRSPKVADTVEENIPTKIDISKIPTFPNPLQQTNELYRIGSSSESVAINLDTKLRIALDGYIDPKKTEIGDYFKASTLEDLHLPTNPEWLIIPRGSWLRGRISYIKRPILFISKKSRIKVQLDQLTTPLGEIIPISAELDIKEGMLSADGYLVPLNEKEDMDLEQIAMGNESIAISPNSSDSEIVNKFIDGYLSALYMPSSEISLHSGKELQILLKRNLLLVKD